MRLRYLIIVALDGEGVCAGPRPAAASGLTPVFERPALRVFASPDCAWHECEAAGGVLGRLFPLHGPPRALPPGTLDEDAASLLHPDGTAPRYWGGYLTVSAGPVPSIARDMSGALPCYHARAGNALLLASDVDLLLGTGLVRPGFDWEATLRLFHDCSLPTAATALTGIRELLPGFSLEVSGGEVIERARWSPWDHVVPDCRIGPEQAAERLRRTVQNCVSAIVSPYRSLLLALSGGLDSSILAACLASGACDRQITCLTLFGEDPGADERDHARAVCAHLGLTLVERPFRLEDVKIEQPLAPHLPRPIGRTLAQSYERAHLDVAAEHGIDAFVTGSGGDNVFNHSRSAAALADRLRVEGLGLGLLATLRDIVAHTGCSPLEAIAGAMRLRRRHAYVWRSNPAFLHPDAAGALAASPASHPWLEAPARALAGNAAHIAALLRVQLSLEPARNRHAPVLFPLLSQPIVEACLAIPSWQWRTGGVDRALARQAFADALPPLVLNRRLKGGPDSFGAALVRHHRVAICERLLEGRLSREGLLDREAIAAALIADRQTTGEERVRLLDLLDTEAWLDHWAGRLAGTGGQPGDPARRAARPNG